MTNQAQVMVATLAGSCFVVIVQALSLQPSEMVTSLRCAVLLFSVAMPVLAVSSFKVPRVSRGGSRSKKLEGIFFVMAVIAAFIGFIFMFWSFGRWFGVSFIVGGVIAGVVIYLHGKSD